MSDHYTREIEPPQDDLLRCFGCGVMSDRVPVFVQPHDPDPATWEANPPCLCERCRDSLTKPKDALNALAQALITLDRSLAHHRNVYERGHHVREGDLPLFRMHSAEIYNRIQLIRRRLEDFD